MKFSVILSVDVPASRSIRPFLPTQRHLFETTERDDLYDYEYLGGEWSKGKHRKLIGVLNKKQFARMVDELGLITDGDEGTSLGAPGFGLFEMVPAIVFRVDSEDVITSCYVTPIPEVKRKSGRSDREENWNRIKRVLVQKWGSAWAQRKLWLKTGT